MQDVWHTYGTAMLRLESDASPAQCSNLPDILCHSFLKTTQLPLVVPQLTIHDSFLEKMRRKGMLT